MAKELKIKVIEVKDITSKKTGQKFKAYRCVGVDGIIMDLKFVREARNVPSDKCWIYVDAGNVNVSLRTEYPTVWVKDVNRIEPLGAGSTNGESYFAAADESEGNPF